MAIRAILLDFDGTSLQGDQIYISPRNMSALQQAIDRGVEPSEEIIADLTRWQAVLDDMLPVNARDDDETEANNGG